MPELRQDSLVLVHYSPLQILLLVLLQMQVHLWLSKQEKIYSQVRGEKGNEASNLLYSSCLYLNYVVTGNISESKIRIRSYL